MSNTPFSKKYFAEGALLLVTLLWGGTFVIVKESLSDASPMLFIAMRFSFASIFLIPFAIKNKHLFDAASVKAGLFLGTLIFVAFAAQTAGLRYTTATKSGFITGSLVVMVPIFQLLIEKRKPSNGAIIGIFLVFVGILFLSSGGNSIFTFLSELGGNFNIGDSFTLLCAALFALHVVYLDVLTKKYDYRILVFFQIVVAGVLGFIFAYGFNLIELEKSKITFSGNLLFGILYTALFATVITTILQTKYQKEVSPTKAGIVYSFEPIFAALFAFFVLSEKITNFGFVGSLLIFSGLIVSEVYDSLKKKNGINKSQS